MKRTMKKFMIILAVLTSLLATALVSARDANRDSMQSRLACQQRQQQLWVDVMKKSGVDRNEALRLYSYDPRRCDPQHRESIHECLSSCTAMSKSIVIFREGRDQGGEHLKGYRFL